MADAIRSILATVSLLAVLLLATLPAVTVLAQGDPAVGSWELNPAKSRYSPGPPMKSQTIAITAIGNRIRVVAKGVDGDGKPAATEYTAPYDGTDVPVLFNLVYDSLSLKRIDRNNAEVVRKKGGKVVQTAKRSVSDDGRTMTITTSGVDDKGRKVENVAVYDRK